MASRPLGTYREKRDFAVTPEPTGAPEPSTGDGGPPRFVVQEHHARALHWDLRLERDGVLASWAVPKGIPPDPKRNHLAVQTEDHPLEYLTFEGDIPAGEYGGGRMRVWDRGTYECEKWSDREVMVVLHGERVQGRYVLFRTRGRDWMIHRMDPPADPDRVPPPELRPMLATAAPALPRGDGWAVELKWDGIRALTLVEGGRVTITTRNGNDVTRRYPELRALGRALGSTEVLLDGEIVALDESGRPSFQRLQERMHVDSESAIRRLSARVPVTYMVFDVLWLDGHRLTDLPYSERRARLADLGLDGPAWRVPPHEVGSGAATLEIVDAFDLEGVVAKRLDSRYEPGRRSDAWRKVKRHTEQELVVGGWLPGEGGRQGSIGSLAVGYFDDDGALHYAGNVGSGLRGSDLDAFAARFATLARPDSPFGGPARALPKGSRFVEPEVVVEVRFNGWTASGRIRQPVFRGERPDRDPRDVRRET